MKLLAFVFITPLMLLFSCSKEDKKSSNSELIDDSHSDSPNWAPPSRPEIEVYINHYTLSENQGTLGKPNFHAWNPSVKWEFTYSMNYADTLPYTAMLKYLGTRNGDDHYKITLSCPKGSDVETSEHIVIYKGSDVELFKDHDYRIGIRPRTD